MCINGVGHRAEHDDSNDDTDPQADGMNGVNALAHFRDAFAHIEVQPECRCRGQQNS